jgi:hypothetical protein
MMFLIMIVSIIVVVPATFIATFALAGGSSFWNDNPHSGPPDSAAFGIARAIVAVFVVAWIAIGIRQWFVLSKWTKKYKQYKELQKKIDEKLDYDTDEEQK